jgi:hypothetical protein
VNGYIDKKVRVNDKNADLNESKNKNDIKYRKNPIECLIKHP